MNRPRDRRSAIGPLPRMEAINDDPSHPLRFVVDGRVIGQFYNSWDKTYHLAEYEPYTRPPMVRLCGSSSGNFSPSRSEHGRKICAKCWEGFPK